MLNIGEHMVSLFYIPLALRFVSILPSVDIYNAFNAVYVMNLRRGFQNIVAIVFIMRIIHHDCEIIVKGISRDSVSVKSQPYGILFSNRKSLFLLNNLYYFFIRSAESLINRIY